MTGCWTSEPCDGYCVDTSIWVGCGDQWAIVQSCEPYQSTQQANTASVLSTTQAEARLFRELRTVDAGSATPSANGELNVARR